MEQRIILSDRFESDLALCISECEHDGIFVICDTSSHRFCWSEMAHFPTLRQAEVITIVDGDANKNLRQLTRVWERLQKGGANRHSLVINLGGGMVTDLGGFAAATFKRGLSFINVPTTLLAMVDASVGGKTGINFGGMKNEIGTFQDASRVIINTDWLKTLDTDDLRSGYAEMLKHGLLDSQEPMGPTRRLRPLAARLARAGQDDRGEHQHQAPLRQARPAGEGYPQVAQPRPYLRPCHRGVVAQPPGAAPWPCRGLRTGLRTLSLYAPHGFPTEQMQQTVRFVREFYGTPAISCQDYDELVTLMHHDKKSHHGEIRSVLLSGFGRPIIDQTVGDEEAREALDFLREGA